MTVLKSGISWCTGTLNLTRGCTKVSAGCDNCYAEMLVHRTFAEDFGTVRFFPERLKDLAKFRPAVDGTGRRMPKLVFVNSLSDFWHDAISDEFIHRALDAFEAESETVLQILTKRPVRMRRILSERYRASGIPGHLWFGVSCEDNRVAARLNFLRRLKDQVGEFCAFVSVEPIIGPTDQLDFTGIDWVLTGGESGPRCRPMQFPWLERANDQALSMGAALHFKQFGHAKNNPVVRHIMTIEGLGVTAAFAEAVRRKLELAPHEKGGATYNGRVVQQKPQAYLRLVEAINRARLAL